MAKPRNRLYTDEQIEFIKSNYKGTSHKCMAEMINAKFGTSYTPKQMQAFYKNHKLNSGLTGRFEKGNTPPNKGKKLSPEHYERIKATMFKPGNKPVNWRPLGSERVNVDGYIEIKVRDCKWGWDLKHRVIWEKANGPVPKGYRLMFLDGNKLNCTLDNLALVLPGEMKELINNRLITSDSELTRTGLNAIRLRREVRRLKNGRKEDRNPDNRGG